MMARISIHAMVIMFCASTVALAQNDQDAPSFEMPKSLLKDSVYFSDSGYIRIEWTEDENNPETVYILEESRSEDFTSAKVIYEGHDRASFISGLPNGMYYYRIRKVIGEEKSSWSEVIPVKVKHHNLYMAFGLAGLGLIVFLLTTGIVIKGVRANETE